MLVVVGGTRLAIPQIPDFERFLSSISTDAHAAKDGRQFF
jgi:hypothetical protein